MSKGKSFGTLDFALLKNTYGPYPFRKGRISDYPSDDGSGDGVYPHDNSWNPVDMQVTTSGSCFFSLDFHSQGSDRINTYLQVS